MTEPDEFDPPPFDPLLTYAENLAEQMGVSVGYAYRLIKRHGRKDEAASHDARRSAMIATTEAEVLADLDDIDIADIADADDPKAEMKTMVMTRAERRMRAQIAAHTRWAHTDEDERAKQTQRARDAMETRFENEVDPDRKLAPDERARRAAHAKKAYFTRLAYKSAKVRRQRKLSPSGE